MRCPWPVLRVARAARQAGAGVTIHVVADDPAAPGELARLVAANGWSISPADTAIGRGSAITVPPRD